MSFVPDAYAMPRLLRRLIPNATLPVRGWLVQALVQVTAQLLTVYPTLTKYCRAGTGPYKPLVGIVTDAERFAVVILDHETLYLMNCCSHKIRSYDGVSDVAKSIQSVISLSAKPPCSRRPLPHRRTRRCLPHSLQGAIRAWSPCLVRRSSRPVIGSH